jgi:hypothetical protein
MGSSDKIISSDITRDFNTVKNLSSSGRNETVDRSLKFPKILAFKMALDSGLIRDGEPLSRFNILEKTINAPKQSYSDGVGGIAIIKGHSNSSGLSTYRSSGNFGAVEAEALRSFDNFHNRGSTTPIVAMVFTYNDAPDVEDIFIVSNEKRREAIVSDAEKARNQWVGIFKKWESSPGDPILRDMEIRARASYLKLTLKLTYDEFFKLHHYMVWGQSVRPYNLDLNIFLPEIDGTNFTASVKIDNLTTIPYSKQEYETATYSWSHNSGNSGKNFVFPENKETAAGHKKGTYLVLYRRNTLSLTTVQVPDKNPNLKSSGVVSEGDFSNGVGKSAEISSKINDDRASGLIEDSRKKSELDGLFSKEKDTLVPLVPASLGGQYIISYESDVSGHIEYRLSSPSESLVINNYIEVNGIPSRMKSAIARNESFSFDKSAVDRLRDGKAFNIDISNKIVPSSITPVKNNTPTSKSFNFSSYITGGPGFPVESSFYGDISKNCEKVVKGVSGMSRDTMLKVSSSKSGDTVKDLYKKSSNYDSEFYKKLNSKDVVGMGGRNKIYGNVTPKPETHAVIRVIRPFNDISSSRVENKSQTFGNNINGKYIDSTTKQSSNGFEILFESDNFLIQGVSENDAEKVQLVQTFGDSIAFFFGRRPRVYHFTGVLFNSGIPKDTSGVQSVESGYLWKDLWKSNYDKYLRGTKCVENKAKVVMVYDEVIVEGFIMSSSTAQSTQLNQINFSFDMFITKETLMREDEASRQNSSQPIWKSIDSQQNLAEAAKKKTIEDFIKNTGKADLIQNSGPKPPLGNNLNDLIGGPGPLGGTASV